MPHHIDQAAKLARVQELHDAGYSLRKIAEQLAAEGVPPAGPRSKWHHANVRWCLDELERQNGAAAAWGLSPQLRARLAAQGQEIEGLTVAALQRLSTSVQAAVEDELDIIRSETARQTAAVRRSFARLWPWLVYVGLAICLGLAGGGWAIGVWLTKDIKEARAELAAIEADIKDGKEMLRQLDQKTGGLEVVETEEGRVLIWARGGEPYKTKRGRWAAKLGEK